MARRGRKPKRRIDWESHKGTISSAFSLLFILLAVISALSLFAGLTGSAAVNSKLRNILVDTFGTPALLLPIILIYSGLFVIGTIRWKILNKRIMAGLLIMFFSLISMIGQYGGTAGDLILKKTATLISKPGGIFLYFVLFVFSIVLITNTGIGAFIEKFYSLIDFIKEKIFKIMPKPEIDLGDDMQSDSTSTEEPLLLADDTAIESGSFTFSSPSVEENLEKKFTIVNPPSGPIDEDNILTDEVKEEAESVEEPKQDSRLPFSNKVWEYPPLSLLGEIPNQAPNAGNVQERAHIIEETLKAFGVKASISDVNIGPAVTQYALSLAIGTKANKIQNLSTDLALRLKSPSGSVRVVAPIPGTNLVGIEVPNFSPSTATLKSVLESEELKKSKNKLAVALGHDVAGKTIVQDIARWPHALVAGATGSGKSVMLNAIIATLLYRCSPAECRFIMIDPKLVELSQYNGIPHLLTPVVTDIEQKAVSVFAWAIAEMERRYKLFANAGVRNLEDFNKVSGFQAEPYIVIVVDELADMMMVAASEIEKYITRLAQKSRATGIHLLLATQRPSVNILTGTIKANIPTRVAFKVTSNVDSRVIIDQAGAETLIGRGDMLFVPPDDSKPRRIQGVFVADKEVTALVDFLKKSGLEPEYKEEIVQQKIFTNKSSSGSGNSLDDEKLREALEIVISENKASASYLQRKLAIGYSRAARMIDDMQDAGIIGESRGSKPRDVLVASVEEALERMG